MVTEKSALGRLGEDAAAEFLVSLGYKIIMRNYRCRCGEIDIIAEDAESDCLVIAEVKSRRDTRYSVPSQAVNAVKQRKIIESCRQYMIDSRIDDVNCRFDVLEVYFLKNKPIKVIHIPAAFCDEGQAL